MKKVLITREKGESEKFAEKIKKYGLEAVVFPTIKTVPLDFPLEDIYNYDVFVFTSKNAIKYFFMKVKPETLREKIIIAVGEKTKANLEKIGFKDVIVPDVFSSEGLSDFFLKNIDFFVDKKILIPRAKKGMNTLIDNLVNKVKEIRVIPVYETILNIPENKEKVKDLFEKKEIDFVVFTSPSTFRNFLAIFKEKGREYLKEVCITVIGSTTKKAVEKEGLSVCIVPEKFTVDEIIREIKNKAKCVK